MECEKGTAQNTLPIRFTFALELFAIHETVVTRHLTFSKAQPSQSADLGFRLEVLAQSRGRLNTLQKVKICSGRRVYQVIALQMHSSTQ